MIQFMFIVAWLAASFSVATASHHIPLVAADSLEAAHSLKAAHSPVVAHAQVDSNLPELNSRQVYSGMMQMESKERMVEEKDIRRPLNIAHRGFSGRYPAHSMQGYIQGARAGADYIECDIQFTRDKVPVCLHNYWLSGVTDVAEHPDLAAHKRPLLNISGEGIHEDWAIWDLTLAEAKTLRLRQEHERRSKEFDGLFSIPTFDEFVQAAREYGIGIYPELKHPSLYNKAWRIYNSTKTVEEVFLEALTKNRITGHKLQNGHFDCIIQSFDIKSLLRLSTLTDIPLVLLAYDDSDLENVHCFTEFLYGVGIWKNQSIPVLPNRNKSESTELVKSMHDLNLKVHVYTFKNDDELPWKYFQDPAEELEQFYKLGVDGFFTDFPPTLTRFLDCKNIY